MCGYFANTEPTPEIIEISRQMGIVIPTSEQRGYQRQDFNGLITKIDDNYHSSNAFWWYALKQDLNNFKVDTQITSFNARDTSKPLWNEAFQYRRGIVFANEVGESQGKQKYLMKSDSGFALGCLYKDWHHPNGQMVRSFAVITRPPHPNYSEFHSKSIPLFLPLDLNILNKWLEPSPLDAEMTEYVEQGSLVTGFDVFPVTNYKNPEITLFPLRLEKDQ